MKEKDAEIAVLESANIDQQQKIAELEKRLKTLEDAILSTGYK